MTRPKLHFSKPSTDLRSESKLRLERDAYLLSQQDALRGNIEQGPVRHNCTLCNRGLTNNSFVHRCIEYVRCLNCGHILSRHELKLDDTDFHKIYPPISKEEFYSRVDRIYRPKFDWIKASLGCSEDKAQELFSKKWAEIGCGAGGFISAISEHPDIQLTGFESNSSLAAFARSISDFIPVIHWKDSVAKIFETFSFDVYVAFFVFEHVDNLSELVAALSRVRCGTILIFAVPVYGVGTYFEGVFDRSFARGLDGRVHNQLFTDRSITFLLERAGFVKTHEWIFGQDASDIVRFLRNDIGRRVSECLAMDLMDKVESIENRLQSLFDTSFLADQRHIIAIKA